LLPIDRAIVKVVNDLMGSHQWYKVASKKTLATGTAKGVFDPEFANGLAFDEYKGKLKRIQTM
jgi:hypothetical protein